MTNTEIEMTKALCLVMDTMNAEDLAYRICREDDLNAIQSAVLAQDEEFQEKFALNLERRMVPIPELASADKFLHQLTARDWAEAFIETLKGLGRL